MRSQPGKGVGLIEPETGTLSGTGSNACRSKAQAGLSLGAVPDPPLLGRSAVASTLVAGLDLARQGRITLARNEGDGQGEAAPANGAE